MTYENVSWNSVAIRSRIASGLSESEFVADGLRNGQYRDFATEDQVAMLKEVYRLIQDEPDDIG